MHPETFHNIQPQTKKSQSDPRPIRETYVLSPFLTMLGFTQFLELFLMRRER